MSDQPFYQNSESGSPQFNSAVPPYVPPTTVANPSRPPAGPAEEGSTTDVVKSQAAGVAGEAKQAAQQVAGTAKDQAGEVVQEAKSQVKELVGQAQSELSDQAQTQQTKAASGLRALGDQLAAMAQKSDQPGMATDVAQQAADRAHQFAGWLESRDPQGVLDGARSFARRKPGVFLVAALGAGVLAGRLARGMSAGQDTQTPGSPQSTMAYPARSDDTTRITGAAAPVQLPSAMPSSSEELVDRLGAQDFRNADVRHREELPGVNG